MPPVYPFQCPKCGLTEELVCSISEYDKLSKMMQCVDDTAMMDRIYEPVSVMQVASPDGYGKKHDSSYQKMKEAAKLDVERASLPPSKRGDINRAIKQLRQVPTTGK